MVKFSALTPSVPSSFTSGVLTDIDPPALMMVPPVVPNMRPVPINRCTDFGESWTLVVHTPAPKYTSMALPADPAKGSAVKVFRDSVEDDAADRRARADCSG